MKNNIALILLLSVVSYVSSAQSLPNSDFETWEIFNDGGLNEYEEPVDWHTPNPFTIQAFALGITKSEDAYNGNYSARLETIDLLGLYQAPGLLTLADFSVNITTFEYSFSGGYFLQENVSKFTGMYKYSGVDGDSASIVIYNFKHPEGEDMDTIGFGLAFLHDAEEWTPFEVLMVNSNLIVPDTFNVMILSSGSTDLKVGSVLLVDSLAIETNTGIIDLRNPLIPLHVYPNPAVETVNFEANDEVSGRELIIYDLNGRIVHKSDFNNKAIRVDVKAFRPGLYTYHLSEKGKRVFSGSFMKK